MNQINFELYRIFYEVARLGNITKASTYLNVSQPAISKQIKNLEELLGGKLFIRTKRGVVLTESGKSIWEYVEQAMENLQTAEDIFHNLKDLEKGTIKIGISTTLARFYLLPYLASFYKKHPQIKIEIFTDPTNTLKKFLKEGKIDWIICKEPDVLEEEFSYEVLGTIHTIFIGGKKYKHLKEKTLSLEEINVYPVLLPKKIASTRRVVDAFFKENKLSLHCDMEIASASLLTDFVKVGMGIGIATKEHIEKELKEGDLFEIKVEPHLPTRHFGMVTYKKIPLSGKAFIDFLKQEIEDI